MSRKQSPQERSDTGEPQAARPRDEGKSHESFMDRVGASASGLMQSSWALPPASCITNDLASLHASAAKGESSSSSSQGGTVSAEQARGTARSPNSTSHALGTSEAFRTQLPNGARHAQEAFDEWSMPGARENEHLMCQSPTLHVDKMQAPDTVHLENHDLEPDTDFRAGNLGSKQDSHVRVGDGAAVMSLLSEPISDIVDVPSDKWESEAPTREPQSSYSFQLLVNNGINPHNLSEMQFASFRQQNPYVQQRAVQLYLDNMSKWQQEPLGRNPPYIAQNAELSQPQDEDRLLKPHEPHLFIPDFEDVEPVLMNNELDERQKQDVMASLSISREGKLGPWLDILDKYQDEVWGDMLPLVKEARAEVKTARESEIFRPQTPQEGPAVRRLKLVLQHLDRK